MKKLAIVGTGHRCFSMFSTPIFEELQGSIEICGLYDLNPLRAKVIAEECGNPPIYDNFDTMLDDVKPDYVLVTTKDCDHHIYVVKALEKGCDVIVEKPMTTDADKCKEILEAEKRTGKKVIVTFNCRFMPFYSAIKKLLKQGVIGEPTYINFQYLIDRSHGADYYRRWHRQMENSGSLLIHKATHHLDIVNWFLEDTPCLVSALGSKRFYGLRDMGKDRRCLTCPTKDSCTMFRSIIDDAYDKKLYYDTESGDGYIRDRCLFSDEIDIYDTMALNVEYQKGAFLQYSLISYSPYEGWSMTITGTEGRIEAKEYYSGKGSEELFNVVNVYDPSGNVTTYNIKKIQEDHGGADSRLRKMLFDDSIEDELGRMAGSIEGAKSLLIGACANISIRENCTVDISKVLKDMNI